MLNRASPDDRSAILRRIPVGEGSRILESPGDVGDWLKDRLLNLSVMYKATQAITHVVDIDTLLPQILQMVFESIGADRGAILLKDTDGELEPKAVRWRGSAGEDERMAISRTIIDHVLGQGEGVITSNAPADARFGPAKSIVNLGIREAICVPVQGRHTTLGVLYADVRASAEVGISFASIKDGPKSRFTKDHLMLMVAIGHQAGLAIENTALYEAKLQAERLAAVGQTIATLSHHIKNILQGIRGGSYLIDMGLNDKDDAIVRRGWGIVEKNQAKIYNLVMDMLSFSKDREPSLETANLNETVADVVELMQSPRRRNLGVALKWSPSPDLLHHSDRPRRPPPGDPQHRDQRHRRLRGRRRGHRRGLDHLGRRVVCRPSLRGRQRYGHPARRGRQDLRGLRLDQGLEGDRPRPARLAEDHPRARRHDPDRLGGRHGLDLHRRVADPQIRPDARLEREHADPRLMRAGSRPNAR